MRDKVIRILWDSPINILDAISSPVTSGKGLYYITRIYADKETSLYLGQSGTSIKSRLMSHLYWTNLYRGKIFVRLGKIIYPRNASAEVIDHAESAIIYQHGHFFGENTCKIYSYSYNELYRVENIGNIHQLCPIIRMHEH